MHDRFRTFPRLAIVVSHPIQYYAPWFTHLSTHLQAEVRVFYLWDFGVRLRPDRGFERDVQWDVDLLSGYASTFPPNTARDPGTHHFQGLQNPTLIQELFAWKPTAILLFGYRYWSHLQVILSRHLRSIPLLFRGDSHLLAEPKAPLSLAIKRLSLRLLFRRFSAFLSVGRANRAYFRRHGVPDEKLFWSPHAVERQRFHGNDSQVSKEAAAWRRELGIPEEHRVILFAGKFERKKRPDDLLKAFLSVDLAQTTLLFVGSGELEATLRHMANGHPTVRIAPFQNQSAMPRVYAAADLVVLPSCAPDETWGMVIHEAIACGKAVVVSDQVGCQSDLVQPHRNGLVFRAGDENALAKALREALRDPAHLKAWGQESQKIVATFSYEEATTGLERALKTVRQTVRS
jgi:glycosyltransferase involved in cell wall biosynthesis